MTGRRPPMKRLTRWSISYVTAVYTLSLAFLAWQYFSEGVLFWDASDPIWILLMPLFFPLLALYGLSSFRFGLVGALPYLGAMTAFALIMLGTSCALRRLSKPVA